MVITEQAFRKFQMVSLAILKEFIHICERRSLRYFAFGGTALGAVRHKGFIPWDNDIDIAMPRQDYNNFLSISRNELPEYLYLQHYSTQENCQHSIIRIVDTRTTSIFKRFKKVKSLNDGIGVDIMPFDGITDDIYKQSAMLKKANRLVRFDYYNRLPWGVGLTLKQNIILLFFMIIRLPLYFIIGRTGFIQKLDALFLEYNSDTCNEIVFAWRHVGCGYERVFKSDFFKEYIYLDFEDIKIRCPAKYDAYLKREYGDYMTPPPPAARVPRADDLFLLDFEHSYRRYNNKKENFDC